jgi:FixJ family two-component response regulator
MQFDGDARSGGTGMGQATPRHPVVAEPEAGIVHVVDDDPSVRVALMRWLRSRGHEAADFESAESFLRARSPETRGCLLLDLVMPGLDGLGLQQKLREAGDDIPIVFLTAAADVPTCAATIRSGAAHFLMKTAGPEELARAIDMALGRDARQRASRARKTEVESRLASLTPREREVLDHVMEGRLNKQIAYDIGTAEKTVKVHRARAMEKMGVRSVAELVRMVERARRDWSTEHDHASAGPRP